MTHPNRTDRRTISVEEAGRKLGVSRNTAYEAVRRGEIPVIRIGRRLLVPQAQFEQLFEQPRGHQPTAKAAA